MRYTFSILCLLICVIGNTHAKGLSNPLSLDYPSWSTTVSTLKKRGYRRSYAEPLSHLESKAIARRQGSSKRLNKVMALGQRAKSKGMLAHRTALFFEQNLVKLNHVVVFSKAQQPQIVDLVRTIEVTQSGAPGVLYEAMKRGQSAKWVFPMKQARLQVSIFLDKEGGVIKIENSALGSEETLEQYRRHLVARMSQDSAS
jgi:hypothetical protein